MPVNLMGSDLPPKPIQPKPQVPQMGTAPNTNWAQGYKPNDPNNIFGTKATVSTTPNLTGGSYTPAPTTMNVVRNTLPQTGWEAPVMAQQSMTVQRDTMPQAGWEAPTMGQAPTMGMQQGPQNGAFQTQYATLENLQPYMNPFLDQIIANGQNAIEHSAAGRGLFGSTGNINDIGTWATNAKAQGYNDAFNRFTNDRGYMTDNFWKNTENSQNQAWKTNAWNYGLYQDEFNGFNNLLSGLGTQMGGLAGTGWNAANGAAGLTQDQASALASLGLSQAQIQALAAQAKGQNNSNGIDSVLKSVIGIMGLL